MTYAGIGSRSTPDDILKIMIAFAAKADEDDFILRSGGATGADGAFALGAKRKVIFKSEDATQWSLDLVKKYLPNDRSNFDSWKPYVKGLMGRNMLQILGSDGKSPVSFVICWTPSTVYEDSSSGGTGYAIRCALDNDIPVLNLKEQDSLDLILSYINDEISINDLRNGE